MYFYVVILRFPVNTIRCLQPMQSVVTAREPPAFFLALREEHVLSEVVVERLGRVVVLDSSTNRRMLKNVRKHYQSSSSLEDV